MPRSVRQACRSGFEPRQEVHPDAADEIVSELQVAESDAVVGGRTVAARQAGDGIERATTVAAPSEKTPAFGTPTVATSPTAYTSG